MKYIATFPDGTKITRKSPRAYSHAWRCGGQKGFSSTEELARKGAAQVLRYALEVHARRLKDNPGLKVPTVEIVALAISCDHGVPVGSAVPCHKCP